MPNIKVSFAGLPQGVTSLQLNWHDFNNHSVYLFTTDEDGRIIQGFALPHSAMEELTVEYLTARGFYLTQRSSQEEKSTLSRSDKSYMKDLLDGIRGEPDESWMADEEPYDDEPPLNYRGDTLS